MKYLVNNTAMSYKFITGLQKGEIEDPFGWIKIIG